jgi:hypothetical protein
VTLHAWLAGRWHGCPARRKAVNVSGYPNARATIPDEPTHSGLVTAEPHGPKPQPPGGFLAATSAMLDGETENAKVLALLALASAVNRLAQAQEAIANARA